ncbi:glutathione S-transferase family protein [Methylobacterium platani]|uniref:Glutathione S-transferase n=2 Tax=Methylobacterium platani TaxID=427683 RepID=A0A179SFD5_9HYPH|nr:glutathione S-transferase family protein [Methylobacterium platani]KMO16652.1 glutathione S-transferase [Methylobacterium platani JCM 14648]OAS26587.1 glutathione S-transferase [Methylobacterium platani]
MLLYEHPLSSYAQKVKIALREKGVAFTTELPETFGTGRSDGAFAQANPRTEVPVLIDGDARIFDSTIILEYVEERWPAPPLLPRDPAARAFARMTEDVCDTQYEAVNWGFGEILWFRRATGALADHLREEAAAQTRILQDWLAGRLGAAEWFGGERFGWADAAAAPMVNRSVHYGLGPAEGSPLARWHARLRERPSVAQTFREFDAAAARMAEAADLYTTGGRRREYRDHRLEWMVKSGGVEVVLAGLRDRTIRFPWPDGARRPEAPAD